MTDASTNLAQKLYAEQQAQTDNAEGEAESGGQSEADDAVDAEFDEVTDEDMYAYYSYSRFLEQLLYKKLSHFIWLGFLRFKR